MNIGVIIPAAGRGVRMGGPIAKQYLPLGDKPILVHSVLTALSVGGVSTVVVAVSPSDIMCKAVLEDAGVSDVRVHVVHGGDERQFTVKAALDHESLATCDVVLVHDAVRPLASVSLFATVAAKAQEVGAVVPVVPVVDTIKEVKAGVVVRTVPRSDLRRVQTPQGFQTEVLRAAYTLPDDVIGACTDDASIVEAKGSSVHVCPGEPWNLKLTKPDDFRAAERHLVETN